MITVDGCAAGGLLTVVQAVADRAAPATAKIQPNERSEVIRMVRLQMFANSKRAATELVALPPK